jgi:galactonate dehydratase
MKVTAIKTFMYHANWNWLLVKLETDEGIIGWGEASTQGQNKVVEAAVHQLGGYLKGKDPRQIELHWSTMFRNTYWRPSFVTSCAMSGLEMAMWDITGKSLNTPVYNLLGGACRERLSVYYNGWWFAAKSHDEYVLLAKREVEKGARALKWDPLWGLDVFASREQLDKAVENIRQVRKAVGDKVELMIDVHGRLSPDNAIYLAREVEELKLSWYEEPIPTDASMDDLVKVANSTSIPICVGERWDNRWYFRDLFEKHCAGIINPDLAHTGGILETKKIADMAHAYYVGITSHSSMGPVVSAASIHLGAITPNFIIHEVFTPDMPFYDEVLKEPFPPIKDGFQELPKKPGLGVEINEEALTKRPYEFQDMRGLWAPVKGDIFK